MATILITGGTGLIGTAVSSALREKGHVIHILSRNPSTETPINERQFHWDLNKKTLDNSAFEGINGVIHLAGAGIADKRWTKSRKRLIIDSRVDSAELLKQAMRDSEQNFDFFITASGSNYYGTSTSEKIYSEQDAAGDDFLAQCCVEWERAAFENNTANRVVALRTAIVLSRKGGALEKMSLPIRFGFGAALGTGKQYVPWIHIDDLVNMYVKAVEDNRMSGAYNAVADEHINQKDYTRAIAHAYNKPLWLPNVPAFLLRLGLGEMASVVLEGSRLTNERVKSAGFEFKFSKIDDALGDLIKTP